MQRNFILKKVSHAILPQTWQPCFQAYDLDAYESSHPISVDVGHPDEINELFDSISYAKGASLIRMMSAFLGESTFDAGINSYLVDYAYDNAEQDDLWAELTAAAEADGVLEDGLTVKVGFEKHSY